MVDDARKYMEESMQSEMCKLFSSEFENVKIEEITPFVVVMRMIKLEYANTTPEIYKMLMRVLHDYNPVLGQHHRDQRHINGLILVERAKDIIYFLSIEKEHVIQIVGYINILLDSNPQLADYLISVLPPPVLADEEGRMTFQNTHALHTLKKDAFVSLEQSANKRSQGDGVDTNGPGKQKKEVKFYNYTTPAVNTYLATQGIPRGIIAQPMVQQNWKVPFQHLSNLPLLNMSSVGYPSATTPCKNYHVYPKAGRVIVHSAGTTVPMATATQTRLDSDAQPCSGVIPTAWPQSQLNAPGTSRMQATSGGYILSPLKLCHVKNLQVRVGEELVPGDVQTVKAVTSLASGSIPRGKNNARSFVAYRGLTKLKMKQKQLMKATEKISKKLTCKPKASESVVKRGIRKDEVIDVTVDVVNSHQNQNIMSDMEPLNLTTSSRNKESVEVRRLDNDNEAIVTENCSNDSEARKPDDVNKSPETVDKAEAGAQFGAKGSFPYTQQLRLSGGDMESQQISFNPNSDEPFKVGELKHQGKCSDQERHPLECLEDMVWSADANPGERRKSSSSVILNPIMDYKLKPEISRKPCKRGRTKRYKKQKIITPTSKIIQNTTSGKPEYDTASSTVDKIPSSDDTRSQFDPSFTPKGITENPLNVDPKLTTEMKEKTRVKKKKK